LLALTGGLEMTVAILSEDEVIQTKWRLSMVDRDTEKHRRDLDSLVESHEALRAILIKIETERARNEL
jgi:hypothetical protein